jgi:hypothetical protein
MSTLGIPRVWTKNPFFVLGVPPGASRAEVERAGARLIALLTVGNAASASYSTPFGLAARDADDVRQAMSVLRDPNLRLHCELWANPILPAAPEEKTNLKPSQSTPGQDFADAARAIGWRGPWPD